ncbi:alpha-ketoglutarate-dependent dioxygenase AlkB [Actinospica sp. MGRD01-02]|uniref:Alpha-ketoglutarate-dependent dioxygenase AlkB n=1 Tax=Actinospica acidithermotolerans TaxID=2828514 RepID=A0A941EAG8_9ACTN|nr:alpha-ketoglutarate-dependent dioxygenase AlkB [Actinospica acidithermotolerans]MBR7826660.1 alpha-ketoglutarate-dependent dioxygenase AlkB [Actinospica acidithermotolerans]
MKGALQGSLLDLADEVAVGSLATSLRRIELGHGAWLDVRPHWITGADELFARLVDRLPWQAERRRMYDRVVDVPRLLCGYRDGEPLPDPILAAAREQLSAHYSPELGEPFTSVGMCLYRDGRDSVAWHGDRFGRGSTHDTMVAILSLGAPRTLALRPRGGGPVQRHEVGHGDLVVMGGSCQRTWDHSVPKTARPVGPRISAQFRPHNVG